MLRSKFDISQSRSQNEFTELREPRPWPKRVAVPLLERENHSLDE